MSVAAVLAGSVLAVIDSTAAPAEAQTFLHRAPDAPTNLRALPGNGFADLYWEAAEGRVSTYEWRVVGGTWRDWSNWKDTHSPATSARIGGLNNGTEYMFEVRARNGSLAGPASEKAVTTPERRHGDGYAIAHLAGNGTGNGKGGNNGGAGSGNDGAGATAQATSATVTPTTLTIAENSATGGTYTVVLGQEPSGEVTVTPSSSASNTVTISPSDLSFTTGNWNTAQTVTVTPVDDHVGNVPARTTTISHSATGGGSPTIPSVTVTLTDNDVIVTNLDQQGSITGSTCRPAGGGPAGCEVATSFTTGSNAAGYTLTSATIHPAFESSSTNSGAVNEVAIYTDGTSGCAAGTSRCPGTRIGSKLSGPATMTRTAHHDRDVTYTSSAGVKLAAGTTYWLVVDVALPIQAGARNTAAQTSTDSWSIGDKFFGKENGSWRSLFAGSWPITFAIGAQKLPAAPTGLTATAGNTQVTLSWTNPNNAAITKYQVCARTTSCSESTSSHWTDIPDSGATTTTHIVTGLTNGTTYKFEIRAFVAGPGPASAEVSKAPAATVPAKVSGLTATPGDGRVRLSWRNPNDSSITKYQFRDSDTGSFTGTPWENISSSGASTVFTIITSFIAIPGPINNGTQYYYQVRAVNAAGAGPNSVTVSATPMAAPAKPAGFDAFPENGAVELFWTESTDTSIDAYEVCVKTDGAACPANDDWTEISNSDDSTSKHKVTGLTNGTQYTFRVRAVNDYGNSPASDAKKSTPNTPPAKPTGLTATGGTGSVSLSWSSPSPANPNIGKYRVQFREDISSTWGSWSDVSGSGSSTTTATISTGLTNGTEYHFRILAQRAIPTGETRAVQSAPSDEASATPTESGAPAAPIGLRAEGASSTSITVSWTQGASTITKYQIRRRTGSGGTWGNWTDIGSSGASTTSTTVGSLTTGQTYFFRIRALAGTKIGAPSSAISAASATVPGTPTRLRAIEGDGQLTLLWTKPATGGAPTDYEYCQKSSSSASCASGDWTATGSANEWAVVTGLTNATPYYFMLRAKNAAGAGTATSSFISGTPEDTAAKMYWVDLGDSTLNRADLDGSEKEEIFKGLVKTSANPTAAIVEGVGYPGSIAVDAAGGKMYWTNVDQYSQGACGGYLTSGGSIYRANLDGSNREFLVGKSATGTCPGTKLTNPYGIALDTAGGKMYWVERGLTRGGTTVAQAVRRANLDGSSVETLVSTGIVNPSGIALDLVNNKMYWTDQGNDTLKRADLDGSNIETVRSGLGDPTSPQLDVAGDKVYWLSESGKKIRSSKLDGSGNITDLYTGTGALIALALDLGDTRMYWSERGSINKLRRGTLGTSATPSNLADASTGISGGTYGIALLLKPGKPRDFAVARGDTKATLSWKAPSPDTGGTASSYEYNWKTSGSYQTSWTSAGTGTSLEVTGLTNNTAHTFKLRAKNRIGTGAETAEVVVTPGTTTVPATPTGFTATPGNKQVTLAWNDPSNTSITKYQYCQKTGSNTCSATTDNDWSDITDSNHASVTAIIGGLTNGTQYKFRIRAVNGAGNSTMSDSKTATPVLAKPAKPTGLTAAGNNKRVVLSWADPSNSTITKYQYCQKTGAATCSATTNADWADMAGSTYATVKHTVTGLTNGTTYKFQIRAVNDSGAGPASDVKSAMAQVVAPIAPRVLAVTGGNKRVRLNWFDPAYGLRNEVIDKFQYQCRSGSTWPANWSDVPGSDRLTTSHWVTGLANSTQYTCRVRAYNSAGGGAASPTDNATPAAEAPHKPTGVSLHLDNGKITINWDDPSDPTIDSYQYCQKTDNTACPAGTDTGWTNISDSDDETVTSGEITGLTNGTLYKYRVRAKNSTGTGTMSDEVKGRPANLTLTISSTSVTEGDNLANSAFSVAVNAGNPTTPAAGRVQLDLIAVPGTAEPRDYTFARPGVQTIATVPSTVSFSSISLTMFSTSEDDDTDHETVKIYPTNGSDGTGGDGAWPVGPGVEITIRDDDATPTATTLTATPITTGGAVDLAWTRITEVVTGWQYCRKTGSAVCAAGTNTDWTNVPSSGDTTVSHRVSGLTNGTTYKFQVRAVNSNGNGALSNVVTVVANPVPSTPTSLTATGRNTAIRLTWTTPANTTGTTNNTTITKFQYQRTETSGTWPDGWTDMTSSSASTTSYDVTGLNNATTYYFRIRAVNPSGAGAATASASGRPLEPPGAPGTLSGTGLNQSVRLSWGAATGTVTRYEVCYTRTAPSCDSSGLLDNWTSTGSTATTTTVRTLNNAYTYRFRVRACNSAGCGPDSNLFSVRPVSVPAYLSGLTATGGDKSVTLSWTNPNNTSITKYQYQQNTINNFTSATWMNMTGSSSSTTKYSIGSLTNGTEYWFRIRAVNSSGDGASGIHVNATPGVPHAAYGLTATAGNAQVTLNWGWAYQYPPITKWQYCQKTGSATCGSGGAGDWTDITGTNSLTRHVVGGLTNNVNYKFRVRAVNNHGNGPASAVVWARPQATGTTPAAPTGLSITGGDASVTLLWSALGDSTVTKFQYCRPSSRTAACGSWSDFDSGGTGPGATSGTVSSGLTNGTQYWFRVRAWSTSAGTASAALTATPLGAPSGLAASVDDRQTTLSWTVATGAEGYQYCRTTGAACTEVDWINVGGDGSTASFVVRGLTNETTYTFRLRSTKDNGFILSPASSTVTVTPTRRPGQVTGLTATAGAARVTLSWTAPATTAWRGAPTDYEYCQTTGTDTSACANWMSTGGGTATSKVISSGLSNGTTYRFRVRAKNGAGAGTASAAVTATPVAAPSAPAGLTAAATASQTITLSWTASSDVSITGYEYCQKEGSTATCNAGLNHPDWAPISGSTHATSSYEIVGLNNGTQYAYRVRAVNGTGAGAVSNSASDTPQGTPGAPTGVSAAAGVNRITLTWTAPVGWPITGWQYQQNGGTWTTISGAGATTTSHTVMGLTSGNYTYRVRATNAAGNGDQSAATASTSPTTNPAPAQPQNLSVVQVGDKMVKLSWTWTAAPGAGRPLDQMRALTWRVSTDNGSNYANASPRPLRVGYDRTSGTGTFEYSITSGLTNGNAYTIRVIARRTAGSVDSAASASVTATPTATPPPATPDTFSATAVADYPGEVVIRWGYDLDTLLDPDFVGPTGWQYELNGTWHTGDHCNGGCSGMWTTLRLDPGTTYVIRVRALNGTTPGAPTAAITVTTAG